MVSWTYGIVQMRLFLKQVEALRKTAKLNSMKLESITDDRWWRWWMAEQPQTPPAGGGGGGADDTGPIKPFGRSGIPFDDGKGHKFVFDGFQMIVTHDRRSLDLIERILAKLDQDQSSG